MTYLDDHSNECSTLSASVYDGLRNEILVGTLKPGRKVRMDSVCERYSAGNNLVREVVGRLSAEGLVDQVDQRGFVIVQISDHELRELVTTRCWLEELALTRSIINRDSAWEERLTSAHARMSRVHRSSTAVGYRVNHDWEARHRSFHEALIANCDSRPLLGYCRQLRDQADRYRWLAAGTYSFPVDVVEGQHRGMMECAIAGRADEAVQIMRDHFKITWNIVEKAIFEKKRGG